MQESPRLAHFSLVVALVTLCTGLGGFLSPALAAPATTPQNAGTSPSIDLLRVVVIDVSGSMSETDDRGLSRLDTARRELLESVRTLPASGKTPVVLIPFSDDVLGGSLRTYTNSTQLEQALGRLVPDGHTNIAAGLKEAITQAQQQDAARNLVLYLYSDGEHNVGPIELVYDQERNLDKLFGQRTTKGLSQTVVVKRWGGVIGDMVAHLQKNPNVRVVDAGELELRTITIAPSASIQDLSWRDAAAGLALVQVRAAVGSTGTAATFPPASTLEITSPLAGIQWLSEPHLPLDGPGRPQTFQLLVKLDPQQLMLTQDYMLPLRFQGPSVIKTDRGLVVVITNPTQILCPLPMTQLCPTVTVQAALSSREKPRWHDVPNRLAVWPMRLRLAPATTPPLRWPEQILWEIRALDGVTVTPARVTLSYGPTQEMSLDLARNLSLGEVAQGQPVKVHLELAPVSKPRTLRLSPDRLQVTAEVALPPVEITKIFQQVSSVGEPEWNDLAAGLVTVPVKLGVTIDGMLAPGAVLGLAPCGDVVKVDGVPVSVRSGPQTVEIRLTGKVRVAGRRASWPLKLLAPPPSYGIRYSQPAPVLVEFTTPQPVQVVLSDDRGAPIAGDYHGADPTLSILGTGTVQVVGGRLAPSAGANLRVRGLVQNPLDGTGFSTAAPGQSVSWSMRPADPASSVRWWRDVQVKGSLVLLPENAAPGIVQGAALTMTLTYEAFYKKLVFALAVGLGLVAIATIVFWLTRACLGASTHHDRVQESACGA